MSGFDEAMAILGSDQKDSIKTVLGNGKSIGADRYTACIFVDLMDKHGDYDKLNPAKTLCLDSTLEEILQAIIEAEDAAYAQGP
jgi:hypothetical protein